MKPSNKPYKPGNLIFMGTVLGAFIGILLKNLALWGILGFFLGMAIDANKRKAMAASQDKSSSDEHDSQAG